MIRANLSADFHAHGEHPRNHVQLGPVGFYRQSDQNHPMVEGQEDKEGHGMDPELDNGSIEELVKFLHHGNLSIGGTAPIPTHNTLSITCHSYPTVLLYNSAERIDLDTGGGLRHHHRHIMHVVFPWRWREKVFLQIWRHVQGHLGIKQQVLYLHTHPQ